MPGVSEHVGDMNAALAFFYYDTALWAGVLTISALMQIARPDHVLFRTDFPVAPVPAITKFGQLSGRSFRSPSSRGGCLSTQCSTVARPPRMNFCGNALDQAVEAFSQNFQSRPTGFEQRPGYAPMCILDRE